MGLFKRRYLETKLSPGFIALYSGKTIVQIAYSVGNLFVPIFLYKFFHFQLKYVLLFYFITSFAYANLVGLSAQFLDRVGFRRSLRLSVIFGSAYYFSYYFINSPQHKNYFIVFPIVFLILYRLTYWLPYNTDFAKFTDKKSRGRELSLLRSVLMLVNVASPIAFGFIISRFSFNVMFIIGGLIYLLSGIPYLFIPHTREIFTWNYWRTWKEFFSRQRRKFVLAYMADGAESMINAVIWPIFIWGVLRGNLFKVGAISTLVLIFTIIFQLALGRYADKADKEKILHVGSSLYSLGWIFKIFVSNGFQIFLAATYHKLMRIFLRTPFDTLTYEKADDCGHYVDEFTVIHEMALHHGKSLMMLVIFFASSWIPLPWLFVFGALASLCFNFI